MNDALTGGFDTCLELTEAAASGLASSELADVIGLIPDLRFQLPGGIAAQAHLQLSHVGLDTKAPTSAGTAVVDLRLSFVASAIQVTAPRADHASPLTGVATLRAVPIILTRAGDLTTGALALGQATGVELSVDSASRAAIAGLERRVGAPAGSVIVALVGELRAAITTVLTSLPIAGLTFVMSPLDAAGHPTDGAAGGGDTPQIFARVEVLTRPRTGTTPGVLCVLGTFLARHLTAGVAPSAKTETVTRTGHNASLTVSPRAFHALDFCPAVLTATLAKLPAGRTDGLSPAELLALAPAPCGHGGMPVDHGVLDRFEEELREGALWITGSIGISDTGYAGRADFTATGTLELVQGKIVSTIEPNPEDLHVDISIDWWAYLLAGVIFLFSAGWVYFVGGLIRQFAYGQLTTALAKQLAAFTGRDAAPKPLGFVADAVTIHPGGVVLDGMIPVPAAPTVQLADVRIATTERTLQTTVGASETGVLTTCVRGAVYRSHHESRQLEKTFTATTTGLEAPIELAWTIGAIPLAGSGTLTDDHGEGLDYTVAAHGSRLTVKNHRVGGPDFAISVGCTAVDGKGFSAHTEIRVTFDANDDLADDPRYAADLRGCIEQLKADLARGRFAAGPTGGRPEPGGDPLGLRAILGDRASYRALVDLARVTRLRGVTPAWLSSIAIAPATLALERR